MGVLNEVISGPFIATLAIYMLSQTAAEPRKAQGSEQQWRKRIRMQSTNYIYMAMQSLTPVEYDGKDEDQPPLPLSIWLPHSEDGCRGQCQGTHQEDPVEQR